MWDAIARARPAASFRRHSLEREGDTASRIRSSPLETLIAPRGTDGSNPASSRGESGELRYCNSTTGKGRRLRGVIAVDSSSLDDVSVLERVAFVMARGDAGTDP